jgi:hypothetical protein
MIITSVPLPIKPYKLSLDVVNGLQDRRRNLENYYTEMITVVLAQIVSEIM